MTKMIKCPECGEEMPHIEHVIWGSGSWTFKLSPDGTSKQTDLEIEDETDHDYYCPNPKCQHVLDPNMVARFLGEEVEEDV